MRRILLKKYNEDEISTELINYLIEQYILAAVELELFEDHEGRKRRKFIKGLLNCKIELANNNNYAKEIL